jgi:hypothetical protein
MDGVKMHAHQTAAHWIEQRLKHEGLGNRKQLSLSVAMKLIPRGSLPGNQEEIIRKATAGSLASEDGSPNPLWIEWLMGFPMGWTELPPSATPSSPRSPSGSADA